jgi:ribonuclease HI
MGNPGPMGLGGWLRDADDTVIAVFSVAAGTGTNNEAEFAAMAQAIEIATQYGARGICLRADSELVVKQVKGEYQVRNARLRPLYERVCAALAQLPEGGRVNWISREGNTEADSLASRATGTNDRPTEPIGADAIERIERADTDKAQPTAMGDEEPPLPEPPGDLASMGAGDDPAAGSDEADRPPTGAYQDNVVEVTFAPAVSPSLPDQPPTDPYQTMALEDLFAVIEREHGQAALTELLNAIGTTFESPHGSCALRWCARGLPPQNALAEAGIESAPTARERQ